MLRIRALNEESSDEDEFGDGTIIRKPTREAQEQEAVELYNNSFELVADGKLEEAVSTLEMILDLPFFEEEDLQKCSPMQLEIKLGCLKTLSSIHYSLDPNPEEALRVLKLSLILDSRNVTLWYRLGITAIKMIDYELAYSAFVQGYECSSNHWGCLENLITLAYILFDTKTCLKYCAVGLTKDPGFIRALVFRDHIFRLHPSLKVESKESRSTSEWEALNVERSYSKDWEDKYLSELQKLFRIRREQSEEELDVEKAQNSKSFVCRHTLNAFTFAELCRIIILLYQNAQEEGALLRPVQLIDEFSLNHLPPIDSAVVSDNLEEDAQEVDEDTTQTPLSTRRNSLEKDFKLSIENESGTEATGGTETPLENGDKSAEESVNEMTEKDEDENKDRNKRKSKKDVKWWQMEGKRRSERVRGNLFSASPPPLKKETDVATKLRNIIPISVLTTDDSDDLDEAKLLLSSPSMTLLSHKYFDGEDEISDVKEFFGEESKSNTMDLVISLTQLLGNKSDKNWPAELRTKYLELYPLYTNHVPQPDPFTNVPFIQESFYLESRLALTMLELSLEISSAVHKLKDDHNFNINIFFISEICRVTDDAILFLRFHWFMAKYSLALAKNGHGSFETVRHYLEELKKRLNSEMCIQIPTGIDNFISFEEVQKKLTFVQRMENINRISELYEAKKYAELVEILPFCVKSEGAEVVDFNHRFYLADSYFQLQSYAECQTECLYIINRVKLSNCNSILQKSVILLKRVVNTPDYVIPIRLIRQTVKGMMTLLLTDHRPPVPAVIILSPWSILHALLFKLEQMDPLLYLDEESAPPSVLLLQLAHEQLSHDGKCTLNKGKFLNYILDSLLPLFSNYYYADHENLKHCVEQAIFCLYTHPLRISKIRYLSVHGSPPIPLDIPRSSQLYDYYRPERLPEFDSYNSISEGEAGLFQRFLAVLPAEQKPVAAFNKLKEFLKGNIEELTPETDTESNFDSRFNDIFYLLGDYHFKVKEWTKSTEFYTWDLALNVHRFDSWAAVALSIAERINTQLNACENFNISEIMSSAHVASKCFQLALEIDSLNSKLRIEFGSFLYSMHSFCSRLLKQNADQLSLDHFDLVEVKKEEFLARSARCFEPIAVLSTNYANDKEGTENDEQQHEEVWIHHYMLGKVMEKLNPHAPEPFLEQYEMAGKVLDEQGALYPMKISFYSPQELAIEALEIFYRIHASILNYIEKHDYNEEMDNKLLRFLERASESPLMKAKVKRPESVTENKRKKHEKIVGEVKDLLEEIIGRVEEIVKEDEAKMTLPPHSPSTQSSSLSSEDDSSDSSSDDDSSAHPPPKPVSFGLSVFQEKLREKELRECRLAEAARLAEEKKRKIILQNNNVEPSPPPLQKSTTLVPVNPPMSDVESHFIDLKYGKILTYCLKGMQECISRFPAHHKSYFRIAYTYTIFCKEQLKVSRNYLLGTSLGDTKRIVGLFGDRKPSNFFNGIWRNPIVDIDRPGSFSYHMSKTIQNLLEVLNGLNDHEMLTEIGIQLAKVPDSDKKYLYNFEREQFSQQAITSAIAAAKRLLSEAGGNSQDVALEIYSSYLKIQKSLLKENGMGPILVLAYQIHLKSKGMTPQGLTVDVAFKHYQHLSWTSRIKASQLKKANAVAAGAGLGKDIEIHEIITKKHGSKRPLPGNASHCTLRPTTATQDTKMRPCDAFTSTHVMPSLTLFNNLLAETSTQGQGNLGIQPPKKRILSKPPPLKFMSSAPDASNRNNGREMPNLLSIPSTAENYLRQLGAMFGLQTIHYSSVTPTTTTTSNTMLKQSTPSTSTINTSPPNNTQGEEFILSDLNTSPTLWMGTAWNSCLSDTPTNKSSTVTSQTMTDKQKPSHTTQNANQDFKTQNTEPISRFDTTRSLWDKKFNNSVSIVKTHPVKCEQTQGKSKPNEKPYFVFPTADDGLLPRQTGGSLTQKPVDKVRPRRSSDAAPASVRPIKPKESIQPRGQQSRKMSLYSDPLSFDEGEQGFSSRSDLPCTSTQQRNQTATITLVSKGIVPNLEKLRRSSGGGGNSTEMSSGGRIRDNPLKRKLSLKETTSTSSSILRPPPGSIPLSTNSTFNTSPFKAQSTMIKNPGEFILGLPQSGVCNKRVTITPPAAHAANKTPPHADSPGFPEIIDLTTKSPTKDAPMQSSACHPEAGFGRVLKRPISLGMLRQSSQVSVSVTKGQLVPPKMILTARNSFSERASESPEVITIDSD